MKRLMIFTALFAALSVAACDRPTVVTTAPGPTVAVPVAVPVPGPAGPSGATGATGSPGSTGYTGATGEQGKPGEAAVIIVPPAPSK